MPKVEIYCDRRGCEYNSSQCKFCNDEAICNAQSIDIDKFGNCNTYLGDLNKYTKCSECEELSQYE